MLNEPGRGGAANVEGTVPSPPRGSHWSPLTLCPLHTDLFGAGLPLRGNRGPLGKPRDLGSNPNTAAVQLCHLKK